jgi:hypothetical protein
MTHRLSLLLAITLAFSSIARAETFPPSIQDWLSCEQGRVSRSVDQSRLVALTNHQDPRYAPEAATTFQVKSYWVDAAKMHLFTGAGLTRDLAKVLLRTRDGKRQVRLLVHPESEGLYASFLRGAERGEDLMATATASSRTLLLWPRNQPAQAFMAKLSLDKEIGGTRRTISQGEVSRSLGVNNTLQLAVRRSELPASFGFIPEVLSLIPRGMEEGGMVVRALPRALVEGQVKYVPLFALYAPSRDGSRPLLVDMIQRSGLPAKTFVQTKIIQPFVQQYLELARQGIIPEPHAQNVLLEVGRDGAPTGRFIHRDFGGFNLDFDHRRSAGLALPKRMPTISTLEQDYKIGRYGTPAELTGRNLDVFFYGGFIFNLDKEMSTWSGKGWITDSVSNGTFKQMLVKEVEQQCSALTGGRARLQGDLRNLSSLVGSLRTPSRINRSSPLPSTAKVRASRRTWTQRPLERMASAVRGLMSSVRGARR